MNPESFLMKLLSIPSFSGSEENRALFLETFFREREIFCERIGNNVIAQSTNFDSGLPSLLLCSHIDTVQPGENWSSNPFEPVMDTEKISGLGSNDAGASMTALLFTFLKYYDRRDLPCNLILAAVAEEENGGENGIPKIISRLENLCGAVVGEPTLGKMVVSEKSLLVIDAFVKGSTGHAAHENGINAVELAAQDIARLPEIEFNRVCPYNGKVKISVTGIYSPNKLHNVIPDSCEYTLDIRFPELYEPEEILEVLSRRLTARLQARKIRPLPPAVSDTNPLLQAGLMSGLETAGSTTLSDKCRIPVPTLKMGPGDSLRSHRPDEYILRTELRDGISTYELWLENYFLLMKQNKKTDHETLAKDQHCSAS